MTSLLSKATAKLPTSSPYHFDNRLSTTTLSTITAGTVLAVSATIVPVVYRDYKRFLAQGPGGVPYNVFGWLIVTLLRPLKVELFGTGVYEKKVRNGESDSFLDVEEDGGDDFSVREGVRPDMGSHLLPQRQMSQLPDAELKRKLTERFNELISRNQHLVKLNNSYFEPHSPAIVVADNIPKIKAASDTNGEIGHIHATCDFSVHVVLAPADCQKVFKAGWSQRHPLSGSLIISTLRSAIRSKRPFIPAEYVLIYAPRNEEEIEVIMKIVTAGVKYMTGSKEVNSA